MKGLRISLLVVVAALMIMGVAATTYAFHDGGVADCEGCHTMHNSLNARLSRSANSVPTICRIRLNSRLAPSSCYMAATRARPA